MINKLVSIIIGFLICGSVAIAQSAVLRVEPGFGTFYMKDLKALQTSLIPDIGVNVESISKFPPYFGYGISFVYPVNSVIGLGIVCDYFSTGGRNYYEDYSGSYKLDLLTHAYNSGVVFAYRHFQEKQLTTYFEIQQGVKISKLSLKESLVVTDPILSESYRMESTSFWIKPGYRIEYNFFNSLSVGAFIGGEINPGTKLHLEGDRDASLHDNKGKNVHISWSGFRSTVYLSWNFTD